MALGLAACGNSQNVSTVSNVSNNTENNDVSNSTDTGKELENGVSAIEDAMSQGNLTDSTLQRADDGTNDLRNGTSDNTVATPDEVLAIWIQTGSQKAVYHLHFMYMGQKTHSIISLKDNTESLVEWASRQEELC